VPLFDKIVVGGFAAILLAFCILGLSYMGADVYTAWVKALAIK
jgi:hypothetical protein